MPAVLHKVFTDMKLSELDGFFGDFENNSKIIVDEKAMLNKNKVVNVGYRCWGL